MQLLPTSQWEDLVTRDHLDARLAQMDAKIERSTRTVIVWMIGALFASNGMMLAILSATR